MFLSLQLYVTFDDLLMKSARGVLMSVQGVLMSVRGVLMSVQLSFDVSSKSFDVSSRSFEFSTNRWLIVGESIIRVHWSNCVASLKIGMDVFWLFTQPPSSILGISIN